MPWFPSRVGNSKNGTEERKFDSILGVFHTDIESAFFPDISKSNVSELTTAREDMVRIHGWRSP